jgi:hypothetical protein
MAKTGPKSADRLTPKDFKFAQLVIDGIKPEQAAIECGHKPTAARMAAHRLMDKPVIKNYIERENNRRLEQIRRETEVDDIWITKKFKEILERCMQPEPIMVFDKEAGELRQARDPDTEQLLFKFDSIGAIKAAENLAKHIGYYEIDNKQKRAVIKIGAVQNVANYFFADEEALPPQQEDDILEIDE